MASRYGPFAAKDRNDKDRKDEEIYIAFDPALSDQRSATGSGSEYSPFNPGQHSELAQKLRALGEDSDLDSLAEDDTSGTPFQTAQYASIDSQLFYLMLTVRSATPVPSAAMGATHYFITEGLLSAPKTPEIEDTVVPRRRGRLTPYLRRRGRKDCKGSHSVLHYETTRLQAADRSQKSQTLWHRLQRSLRRRRLPRGRPKVISELCLCISLCVRVLTAVRSPSCKYCFLIDLDLDGELENESEFTHEERLKDMPDDAYVWLNTLGLCTCNKCKALSLSKNYPSGTPMQDKYRDVLKRKKECRKQRLAEQCMRSMTPSPATVQQDPVTPDTAQPGFATPVTARQTPEPRQPCAGSARNFSLPEMSPSTTSDDGLFSLLDTFK